MINKYRLEYKKKFKRSSYHMNGEGNMSDHYVGWLEKKLNTVQNKGQSLPIDSVVVPKGTLCECKGSGGIRMNGTCARCNKPLEFAED